MNFDENAYALISPNDMSIAAVGVRLLDRPDFLVGVYMFWDNFKDARNFLKGIVQEFGEARLYAINKNYSPGLVCKMSVDLPHLVRVPDDRLQLELLAMRASSPKPFLGLRYSATNGAWAPKSLPALTCIDSNWSYIPN